MGGLNEDGQCRTTASTPSRSTFAAISWQDSSTSPGGLALFSAKHIPSTFSDRHKTTNCTTCKHRNVRISCCHHCHLPFSHTLYLPPTQDASHLLNDVTFLGSKNPNQNLHLSRLVGPASCMMFCQVRAFCRGAKFDAPEGCKACGKYDWSLER